MTFHRLLLLAAAIAAAPVAVMPAQAQQQSESYKFLQAVRQGNGNDVIAFLDRPGSQLINSRDAGSGEGALHIVVKRGDETYLRYLLQKGADPNLRDRQGTTPLVFAVRAGQTGMIPILGAAHADANLGNQNGETPLILAVQRRDIAMVRALIAIGADPDRTDTVAGLSARNYADQDPRNAAVAKLLASMPKKKSAAVAGPKF